LPESTVGLAPWPWLWELGPIGFLAGGLVTIPVQIAVVLMLLEVKFTEKLWLALMISGGATCGLLAGAYYLDISTYLVRNSIGKGEIRYLARSVFPMCTVCACVPLFVYRMFGGKPIRRLEFTGETQKISLKMVFVMMTALALVTFWTSVDTGEFVGTGQRLEDRQPMALVAGGVAGLLAIFYLVDVWLLLGSRIKPTKVLAIGIIRVLPIGFVIPMIFFTIVAANLATQISLFQKMVPSLVFAAFILGGYLVMTFFLLTLRGFGFRLAVIDLSRG